MPIIFSNACLTRQKERGREILKIAVVVYFLFKQAVVCLRNIHGDIAGLSMRSDENHYLFRAAWNYEHYYHFYIERS